MLITLPSVPTQGSAAANRPSRYETRLAHPIRLDGVWQAALVNFTYPNEWTCLASDYRFTIAYPAPGKKLTREVALDLEVEQPMEKEIWPQFLSSDDLELCNDRLSLRLLHFSRNAPHWNFSDEVLYAADCSNPLEICVRLENIINRV